MFDYWKTLVSSYLPRQEKGQDLAEYALLIGLIAIAVIIVLGVLGGNINTIFTYISTKLAAVPMP